MSIKAMSYVWEHSQHKGGHLLLLLAIADHAADDGYCWPRICTLAAKTRLTPRHVMRTIQRLEQSGELYVVRNNRNNRYVVIMGRDRQQIAAVLEIRKESIGDILSPDKMSRDTGVTSIGDTGVTSIGDTGVTSIGDTGVTLIINESSKEPSIDTLSSEKSPEPSVLDDYLGPKPSSEPLVVGRWQDKYQEWSRAGGDNIRSRNGISEDALRHTHWLLTEAGKAAPRSTAGWKMWRAMLSAVYEEASGNFATIDAIAHEIVKRGKWAGKVGNWHNVAREVREQRVTSLGQNLPQDGDFVPASDFFAPLKDAA